MLKGEFSSVTSGFATFFFIFNNCNLVTHCKLQCNITTDIHFDVSSPPAPQILKSPTKWPSSPTLAADDRDERMKGKNSSEE